MQVNPVRTIVEFEIEQDGAVLGLVRVSQSYCEAVSYRGKGEVDWKEAQSVPEAVSALERQILDAHFEQQQELDTQPVLTTQTLMDALARRRAKRAGA